MRMWMLDPRTMCRRHLLGEHVELHMLAGSILRGKTLTGFVGRGLIQPGAIAPRHAALAAEMRRRGYSHASPLIESPSGLDEHIRALARYPEAVREATVDAEKSLSDLLARCPECRRLFRDR